MEQIDSLNSRIEDIKKITELTEIEIQNIHKQNEDIVKNQQIILEKTYQIEQMEIKDKKLEKVLDVLYMNENTLKFVI
jgi:hypothetical protein